MAPHPGAASQGAGMNEGAVPQTGPNPNTSKPAFELPAGSCDAHVHIYGPRDMYPFMAGWDTRAFDAPNEWLAAMHARIGVERCVVVHGAPHGHDLRVTSRALSESGGRYRGVALLDPSISAADLRALHEIGYRGARFNIARHLGVAPDLDAMARVVSRIRPLGWHVCLHMTSDQILGYERELHRLDIALVFDHLIRIDPRDRLDQAPFVKLQEFLRGGRDWVKLSGFEKLSHEPYPHDDILAFAAVLVEVAPDRVLWGTDWPHPLSGPDGPPDDGGIVDLIPRYAPDATAQRKLLIDNPAHLYGFDAV